MPKKQFCWIVEVCFVTFALSLYLADASEHQQAMDSNVFPITEVSFGHDQWQHSQNFWSEPLWDDSEMPWRIMGLNKIGWSEIEPYAPVGGQHTYVWNLQGLDDYARKVYELGQRLQLQFYPRSPWGCEYWDVSWWTGWEKSLQSPPKAENMEDWKLAVQAIVDRYNGDSDGNHAPWLPEDYQLLYRIDIGAEVEFDIKWGDNMNPPLIGKVDKYFETLKWAYQGADAAGGNVLVGRAGWAFLDLTDDNPTDAEIETRLPLIGNSLDEWITGTVNNQQYFDVMNLHPAGKYTCTLAIVRYLRNKGLSSSKMISAEDICISPHNGYTPDYWGYLSPLAYEDNETWSPPNIVIPGLPDGTEDIIQRLDIENWQSGIYQTAAQEFFPDVAGEIIKRLVFGLRSGISTMYIQPCVDGTNEYRVWRHAGLVSDVYHAAYQSDIFGARKQAYFEFKWLYSKINGVTAGSVLLEEPILQDYYFPLTCVYELTQASGEPLWVMWHDYTVDHQTPYEYVLDVDQPVYVYETITNWGQQEPNAYGVSPQPDGVHLILTNRPIIVELAGS